MPDDNIEVLDDFILDMDIETITLDDMEFKEPAELPEIEEVEPSVNEKKDINLQKNQAAEDIDLKIGNVKEGINIDLDKDMLGDSGGIGQNISIGTLNIIGGTPEPELPKESSLVSREFKPLEEKTDNREMNSAFDKEVPKLPESNAAPVFNSEDDIIFIDGKELDKMIYGSESAVDNEISAESVFEEPADKSFPDEEPMPATVFDETPDRLKSQKSFDKIDEVPVINEESSHKEIPAERDSEEEVLIPISEIGVESFEIPSDILSPQQAAVKEESSEMPPSKDEFVPLPEETISAEEPISTLGIQPMSTEFIANEEQFSETAEQPETFEFDLKEPSKEEEYISGEKPDINETEKAGMEKIEEVPETIEITPAGTEDFSFDLSVIPDVAEIEEDEPIALSLDELNNIDISEISSPESPQEEIPQEVLAVEEDEAFREKPSLEETIQIVEEPQLDMESTAGKNEFPLDELNEMQEDITERTKPAIQPEAEISESLPDKQSEEVKEVREKIIEEKIDNLSLDTKDELKSVLSYLDNLLENLPEDKIKQFAKSDYYDLYVKILDKLGI